jgi:hypothetical protein
MSKISAAVDRQVRIELLRARAAVEREALVHGVVDLGQALSPAHLIKSLVPRMGMGNSSKLAWQAFSMVRRYPVIMSTVSAIFLRGKRSRLLKLATAATVGWQVYRGWRARQEPTVTSPTVTSPTGPTSHRP